MSVRSCAVGLLTTALATSGLVAVATTPAGAVGVTFRVPFVCGQTWSGTTSPGHSDGVTPYAIDFNHYDAGGVPDDRGRRVVASAAGRVIEIRELETSYGNHITIEHANGMRTLYAHLMDDSITVRVNQQVDKGQVIGRVGNSGGSRGDHLHYEQQSSSGNDVRAVFYGDNPALYYGTRTYQSPAC